MNELSLHVEDDPMSVGYTSVKAVIFLAVALCALTIAPPARADDAREASPGATFLSLVPKRVDDFSAERVDRLDSAASDVERWAAGLALGGPFNRDEQAALQVIRRTEMLLNAKAHVDAQLDAVLKRRHELVALPEGPARRERLRQFLRTSSELIDLSGRLRYLLSDIIGRALYHIGPFPEHGERLLTMLMQRRSSIGATVASRLLIDPESESAGPPATLKVKRQVLRLILWSEQADAIPTIARFLKQSSTPPELKVASAEIIRRLGLWQDPRPEQEKELPTPPITAQQLYDLVKEVSPAEVAPDVAKLRTSLLERLSHRAQYGVTGDEFRVAGFDVREGDWLLMRNPSPYNMFTDLAPGLFTHVGVVAKELGEDGKTRFVITEMPERKARIPATNVEAYLQRTLHYFFVRHNDPEVGAKMGEVAASAIGAQTQFDLTFQTDRVRQLKGQELTEDKIINTYCAGFLLLCSQETRRARKTFFPIPERPAGGHFLANLNKLGLSIGDNFVSPTGALFCQDMQIIGRREPMYEPSREVKEAVYDHFALCMREKVLTPTPNAYQKLRETLASLSKSNPWLARALAQANNVSEHMDLESAAKAAAVIEVLDQIAETNAEEFGKAWAAFMAGPAARLAQEGVKPEEIKEMESYRARHNDLFGQWTGRRLSPWTLRRQLVDYYARRGQEQLEERFFQGSQ